MEKDNKYYGLIEGIVKNHRKFPGCEAVLDEIIDDVYSHSEVVINSVQNESVVKTYIEKVVLTSIITISKRYNLGRNRVTPIREISNYVHNEAQTITDAEVKPAPVSEPELISEQNSELILEPESEPELFEGGKVSEENMSEPEEHEEIRANNAYVDDMINSIASDSLSESEPEEEIIFDNNEEALIEDIELTENLPEQDEFAISGEITEPTGDGISVPVYEEELQESEVFSEIEPAEGGVSPEIEEIEDDEDTIALEDESQGVNVQELSDESADTEIFGESLEPETEDFADLTEHNDDSAESAFGLADNADGFDAIDLGANELTVSEDESFEKEDSIAEMDTFDFSDVQNEIAEEDVFAESEPNEEELSEAEDLSIVTETEEIQSEDVELIQSEPEQEETELTEAEDIQAEEEPEEIQFGGNEDLPAEDEMTNSEVNEEIPLDADNTGDVFELSEETEIAEFGSDIQSDELVIGDDASEDLGFMEESAESFMLEDAGEEISLQQEEVIDVVATDTESSVKNESVSEFHPLNYSAFDYVPSESYAADNADINSLSEQLIKLNDEYPGLKILSVFECKYKKNMSIDDISAALNMEKDEVIQALNELVGIV